MNPQRALLLLVIICCVIDLLGNPLKRRPPRELKILIKALESPQLAEGLVRYLYWDLALFRGLPVAIDLPADESDMELARIRLALLTDGLLEDKSATDPDLVLII